MAGYCSSASCGFVTEESEDRFCPECGNKIIDSCQKCGAKIEYSTQNFCKKCGGRLKTEPRIESNW